MSCVRRAAARNRSIFDDERFNAPAAATAAHPASADDRFATAAAVGADSEINEQNVERVIRQVLERLGK